MARGLSPHGTSAKGRALHCTRSTLPSQSTSLLRAAATPARKKSHRPAHRSRERNTHFTLGGSTQCRKKLRITHRNLTVLIWFHSWKLLVKVYALCDPPRGPVDHTVAVIQ
ncbi:hypothetical protein UPYG_G00032530 [Umbra pygmaea]|uniref:Uncharacterized protein n=1 Tax=Umbra pygmaea TaxID=75934 RepID=A0ABD0XN46_UMBPY